MARPLRIEYPGAYYHVTARGNEREKIFFTKRDCLKFSESHGVPKDVRWNRPKRKYVDNILSILSQFRG